MILQLVRDDWSMISLLVLTENPYARRNADVREFLDGSWQIYAEIKRFLLPLYRQAPDTLNPQFCLFLL